MTTAAKMLPTLISAIKSSLDARAMVDNFEECLLTSDRMRVRHRAETEYWDYKENINLTSDVYVARLARDILGFHNASGGVLVIGVTDDFHISGLAASQQKDATFLRQKLEKYIGKDLLLFQDAIVLRDGKILWLIFVPGRGHAHPRGCLTDGPPVGAHGQREVRKNGLYLRRGDQVISCERPEDVDRLFIGYSPAELHAYTYERDEPYMRLLAPDFDEFVGREQIVSEIIEKLNLRYPVIALDGLGGVGKTATAIHVVKQLSESGKFVFIVSLSAKNRIWQGEQRSRRAGFSGYAEFLREVSTVLLVPQTDDLAEMEELVIETMHGSDGLIVIDNLEEIDDADLTHFITYKVPAPVKVLITSRVAKGWGALTISVPEMEPKDAEKLFLGELKNRGYVVNMQHEHAAIEELYEATGRLPLALKWAAQLAVTLRSIDRAAQELKKFTPQKREFLEFCFKTMWEALSEVASFIAMVRGFLGYKCTRRIIMLIFAEWSEADLGRGINELEDRGLLLNSSDPDILKTSALTDDFMLKKWKESDSFQKWALARIAEADIELGGTLMGDARAEDRSEAMYLNARRRYNEGAFERARRVIEASTTGTSPAIRFLAGRIHYACGERDEGIAAMDANIDADTLPDDRLHLVQTLVERGRAGDLKRALEVGESLLQHQENGAAARRLLLTAALRTTTYATVSRILNGTDDATLAIVGLRELGHELNDTAFLSRWGIALLPVLERAADAATDVHEQHRFRNTAKMIRKTHPLAPG